MNLITKFEENMINWFQREVGETETNIDRVQRTIEGTVNSFSMSRI